MYPKTKMIFPDPVIRGFYLIAFNDERALTLPFVSMALNEIEAC